MPFCPSWPSRRRLWCVGMGGGEDRTMFSLTGIIWAFVWIVSASLAGAERRSVLSVWQASRSSSLRDSPKRCAQVRHWPPHWKVPSCWESGSQPPGRPTLQQYILQSLLLGPLGPPQPSWVAYEASSSPAAFHIVHYLMGPLCQAVGVPAALLSPLYSLFPTLVGTGQLMPVSLVGDPCLYE